MIRSITIEKASKAAILFGRFPYLLTRIHITYAKNKDPKTFSSMFQNKAF
jgi:hypothetical protein